MSLPPSPALSNPTPPDVVRVLDHQLQHGRLEAGHHKMLRCVVAMMNQMSRLLFPHSHIFRMDTKQKVQLISYMISALCDCFSEQIGKLHDFTQSVIQTLPNLICTEERAFYERLREWQDRLSALHATHHSDVLMYQKLLEHYDDRIYSPFLQLHRDEPDHGIWELRDIFEYVFDLLLELRDKMNGANAMVDKIDYQYDLACSRSVSHSRYPSVAMSDQALSPIHESQAYVVPVYKRKKTSSLARERGLSTVGSRRGSSHSRTGSNDSRYHISPGVSEILERRSASMASSEIPRVFTGSFHELEESVKELELDRVDLAEQPEDLVKIKDFAMPTPRLLPSPATLLERREAILDREAEWDKRILAGKVVTSRRSHDRHRAQTISDRSGGLDAWLAEPSTPEKKSRMLSRQQTM